MRQQRFSHLNLGAMALTPLPIAIEQRCTIFPLQSDSLRLAFTELTSLRSYTDMTLSRLAVMPAVCCIVFAFTEAGLSLQISTCSDL